MDNLFIPKKIKVGYQKRTDTYTKKLAYIIYYDNKNQLRKQTSWESWRDKAINSDEFDNVPTNGFVLNKGVGGNKQSYGWNTRNEYIRIYDPRGFEFEISVQNLLFILTESDCSKGKGLEGDFVYSWNGTELVLLPTQATDYQKNLQYTANLDLKVSKKELVPGYTYLTKRNEKLTYLTNAALYTKRYGSSKKVLVFYDDTVNPKTYKKSLIFLSSTNSIAKCIDNTIDINHTAILSKFTKSSYMNPIAKIFIDPTKKEKDMYAYYKTKIMHMQVNPIKYTTAYISTDEKTNRAWVSAVSYETFLNNGVVTRTYTSAVSIPIINTIQDIDKLVNLGYVEGALMIELSNGQIERLHDDT